MRSAIADPYGGLATTDDMIGAKAAPPAPAQAPVPGTEVAQAPAAGTAVAGKPVALPLKPPAPQAQPPIVESQRYTLRLVEHGRVWEVELPESTGGYEVRIPLGPGVESPTLADQEMLGKTPPEAKSKSYLSILAKVGEMYSAHRYELALIEVVDLEQQYPKDARLQAMKGSLYQKLGKSALARDAWKKSLEYDPTDATVAEALRSLKEE
jgi:tetratricopeptide (TPR) repeat protein